MALPDPLPDNPLRWDGWKNYNSPNPYERICLSFDESPSEQQIEENCRKLLVWWQKKLPLKNQPSNPIAQLLRAGMDEAPRFLVEARTELLNPEIRSRINQGLQADLKKRALEELSKFISFATAGGFLTEDDEKNLEHLGATSGLAPEDVTKLVDEHLVKTGGLRRKKPEPPSAATVSMPGVASPIVLPAGHQPTAPPRLAISTDAPAGPADEFRRLLRLSGLSEDDMTDDQRDALCNMGENLGLTGGQAEDLIDEYLDAVSGLPPVPVKPVAPARPVPPPAPVRPPVQPPSQAQPQQAPVQRPAASAPAPQRTPAPAPEPQRASEPSGAKKLPTSSPLARAREQQTYKPFKNTLGMEMMLVTSGTFFMGSNARDAAPNEQPVTKTMITCFYMARHPVTNAQYEKFDPGHKSKRMPGADDDHPVVYVSSLEAVKFCQWLEAQEKRKFRLPTEAEWEYAARGIDGRTFPWGEKMERGDLANFADKRTNFAWRDPEIDDGYAETSPVGSYPKGVSPFGIEDMAGNVWEWCLDFFHNYSGKERMNPRGPEAGTNRIYRGGSWKSRVSSLRVTTRNFNLTTYSSNDVGFRVICECPKVT